MKVLLLSRYEDLGASSRYRSYQYLPYLRKCGYSIDVAPLLGNLYLRSLYGNKRIPYAQVLSSYLRRCLWMRRARSYDLVWLEYEGLPWVPYWLESLFTELEVPYVVDFDDAVFHRYDQHSSGIVKLMLGKKIDHVMRGAALVIAGNDYIAQRARDAGASNIEIVPTALDLTRYPKTSAPMNTTFTIGWIGTPKTTPYLRNVAEVLRDICQGGTARLVTIGSSPIEMNGVPVEVRPWNEKTEVEELMKIDVGIMPLVDSPWERGKCGHKILQYMATCRPVVASPVGVNQNIVQNGTNGFLASTPQEWIRALNNLRDNPALRIQMGESGRQLVERSFSTSQIAPRLASLLNRAAGRGS